MGIGAKFLLQELNISLIWQPDADPGAKNRSGDVCRPCAYWNKAFTNALQHSGAGAIIVSSGVKSGASGPASAFLQRKLRFT